MYLPVTGSTATRRKAFNNMALRSDELHSNLQHLSGMLTTHEAARQLDLSYWHFMHLVEAGRIPGVRVVDRWLFSPTDLDEYRRSKYGELEDMAKTALEHPAIDLTAKQETICRFLVNNERPSEIARKLQQSRQAVHSQITLIREKVSRITPKKVSSSTPEAASNTSSRSSSAKKEPIPLSIPKK
jgi:excisionase family DNA binding protein